MTAVTVADPWRAASNGSGKRHWFVCRGSETIPVPLRFHFNVKGQLIWYASYESAQRTADRLNKDLVKGTVTVTSRNSWYRMTFSVLPGEVFGPYRFDEAIRELRVSALLSAMGARNLVLEASHTGNATKEIGE